ncbi:MAG: cobaltochelatase subunit CobN, partial [Paramuribaculum sp.]|nr:cobaltochelatase subunit CobN [Paramuribaculum sp.]
QSTASTTDIAFVNYQPISISEIGKANDNSHIRIINLSPDKLDQAGKYDMVFVNGMGLRITREQREALTKAAEKGLPVLSTAVTNPQNMIVSTDSVDTEFLKQYLQGGGRENYRSMLNYVRKFIDGKKFFVGEISDPKPSPTGLFYHTDVKGINGDIIYFNTLSEYEKFLTDNGLSTSGKPAIILTGQMGVPDELITELEATGNIVYPITNFQRCITDGTADSIAASAVINMAHGRLGGAAVNYLSRNNIPLFSPLNVNRDYNEWVDDKMGMTGGFLSQSVVTPEIDGAIRPWALFAQYEGDDGVPQIKAIPGRLQEFVQTVNNYSRLRRLSNSDKKVAIFYFKGPGQSSLTAEGMEVAPSLYNLLTRMKKEGYNVSNLPGTETEFEKLINERGKVFGSYAVGEMQRFVNTCDPELISEADYKSWCEASLSPDMIADIETLDGAFPGHGLKTNDGKLAIASLKFGNIVLIPQTAAGLGDDSFSIVHGTDMAPPHAYVGAYLWAKHGFEADALIHFGSHGSLEFTPRKQAALGSKDWSDRLVGTLPHIYVYSTGNVGEAMTAKRRSYAGIVNYLTPPFMESNVRGIYKNLSDAITLYNKETESDNCDSQRLDKASKLVKKYTVELGIHRELRLDSTISQGYTADEVARIENFAEELANEKITGALYTLGEHYSNEKLNSTVYAMSVDPIAYSLYSLKRKPGEEAKGIAFTTRYLTPARNLVKSLLDEQREPNHNDICRVAGITIEELEDARRISNDVEM